jgi:hypothetical protein
MNLRPRFNWVRPFMIVVLIVTVPPLLYWFGYVNRSVDGAVRQFNTTTSAIAASLAARLRAHEQIAMTADGLPNDQPRLQYLQSVTQVKPSPPVEPTPEYHLSLADDERGLLLTVRAEQGGSPTSVSIGLPTLIPWDVVEAEFDGLLLLSSDGRLLTQDRRLPEQAQGLPVRFHRDDLPVNLTDHFRIEGKSIGSGDDGGSAGNPSAAKRWRSPLDFSDFVSTDIAGKRYLAFVQPLRVYTYTIGTTQGVVGYTRSGALDLVMVGLVDEERLRSQAISLSPQRLVEGVALVTLGLLLIPFLKLRFIGVQERMRARDVWTMMASMLGLSAVVVLLVLGGFATGSVFRGFDASMRKLHDSITENARVEVDSAIEQLKAAPALWAESGKPASSTKGASESSSSNRRGSALLLPSEFVPYPLFDTVFAAGADGNQIWKLMPQTIPTGLVPVANRDYFRDAVKYDLAGDCERTANQFIVSMTSGREQMAFARSSGCLTAGSDEQTDRDGLGRVLALSTALWSVSDTVVSAPYEYVLVGRDGTVTFRNAKGPYLGERFFEQVRGGSTLAPIELADAANSGASSTEREPGTYSYRWRNYRMLAGEVPDLEMTLVSFYDTENARGLVTRAFAVAALFGILAVMSSLIGAALAKALWGRSSHDWLWPTVEDTGRYLVGIVTCVVSVILVVLVRAGLPAGWFALVLVVVPGLVTLLCGSPLWFRYRLSWSIWKDGPSIATHKLSYCAFLLSMLLALVAVPTLLAFDDALRFYASVYQRASAVQWVRDFNKERHGVEKAYALVADVDDQGNSPRVCQFDDRLCATQANAAQVLADRARYGWYRECPSPLPSRGHADSTCESVLTPEHESPWSFTGFIAGPLAGLGDAGPALREAIELGTKGPARADARPFEGWSGAARLWWVWAAAGLALLVFLVRSIAVHVLGLGWRNTRVLDASRDIEPRPGMRWLLIRPTKPCLERIGQKATRTVDLRHLAETEFTEFKAPQPQEVLLVTHLEVALEDPTLRDALFKLAAGPAEGCLIFCSEIDPLYYVTQRARETLDSKPATAAGTETVAATLAADYAARQMQRARWASVLSDFEKIRMNPPDCPPLGDHLPLKYQRILKLECSSSERLIEIAQRLANSVDLPKYREDEIIGFVLDAAEPYYRSIWELCSQDERLVLIQLAEEGVVNPKRFDIVRRLHNRGLVVVEPRFDLMNRSFRQFVGSVESPERVKEWEQTSAGVSWKRFSIPLYTLAAVVVAILLFTQQDLFSQMLGIATGAAGALNSLRSLGLMAKAVGVDAKPTAKV